MWICRPSRTDWLKMKTCLIGHSVNMPTCSYMSHKYVGMLWQAILTFRSDLKGRLNFQTWSSRPWQVVLIRKPDLTGEERISQIALICRPDLSGHVVMQTWSGRSFTYRDLKGHLTGRSDLIDRLICRSDLTGHYWSNRSFYLRTWSDRSFNMQTWSDRFFNKQIWSVRSFNMQNWLVNTQVWSDRSFQFADMI
jgi:hypothetical protein